MLVQSMVEPTADTQKISYSELIVQIKNDNIKSLSFTDSEVFTKMTQNLLPIYRPYSCFQEVFMTII